MNCDKILTVDSTHGSSKIQMERTTEEAGSDVANSVI